MLFLKFYGNSILIRYTSSKKDTPIYLCMVWNRGNLSEHNTYSKSYQALGLLAPNRNEVLYALVGQETSKILEVKVCVPKNIAYLAWFDTDTPSPGYKLADFFLPRNLTCKSLSHLKDMIQICLGAETQGHDMTN